MNSLLDAAVEFAVTHAGWVGRLVVLVASVQLLVGLYFLRLPLALNALAAVAKQPLRDTSLRSIYPSLPTFLIPESFWGFALVLVFFMTGVGLIGISRVIDRGVRT